jgi:DNA-binding transcriptional ArsR family regulator
MTTKVAKRSPETLLKALTHPIRLRVLRILGERVSSPNEMASELGEDLSTIAYHVKVLNEAECIELVDTKQRRGATEHYYRPIQRGHFNDEDWDALSRGQREEISAVVGQELFVRFFGAQQAHTLDARKDRHLSWIPLTLDEKGFEELEERLRDTFNACFEIEANSAARRAANDEAGKPAVVGLMGFEMPAEKPRARSNERRPA